MNKPVTDAEQLASARLTLLAKGREAPVEVTQAIARLVGPVFCAIGIGMLISPAVYRELAVQFLTGYGFIYFSGVLILLSGLIILNAHHVWTPDWRICITLLGWIFACVGAFRLIAPQFVAHVGGAMFMSGGFFVGAGLVFLALGAFLTFKGHAA